MIMVSRYENADTLIDIMLDNCTFLTVPGLPTSMATYLGRPWKSCAQVVFMSSTIYVHINQLGWSPWNKSNLWLDSLYFAEYHNLRPSASLTVCVKWTIFHVLTERDVHKFKVLNIIHGSNWLP
jgi:pectinesterase